MFAAGVGVLCGGRTVATGGLVHFYGGSVVRLSELQMGANFWSEGVQFSVVARGVKMIAVRYVMGVRDVVNAGELSLIEADTEVYATFIDSCTRAP